MTPTGRHESADDRSTDGLSLPQSWETGSENSSLEECADAAAWREKWAPPCPDGSPQELRPPLGFRERNIGELELRVPLCRGDHGACQVIVDERDDEVYVRVLVCRDEQQADGPRHRRSYTDCPVRVWLDRPLGDRAVIDVDSDDELSVYTPRYLNNVLQADAGYRQAHRRRRKRINDGHP